MKDELFTDEALEAALTTIQKKHLDDLLDSMEPHDFSEEFEQKMEKLMEQDQIPRYVLTWVPEGCELYKEENTVDQTYVYYDPGDSARGFTVAVMPLNDDRGMVLDGTEDAEITMLLVRGCSAQLYTFPDHYILIWMDENARVVFSVTCTLTAEELLQIAEGLVPEK